MYKHFVIVIRLYTVQHWMFDSNMDYPNLANFVSDSRCELWSFVDLLQQQSIVA